MIAFFRFDLAEHMVHAGQALERPGMQMDPIQNVHDPAEPMGGILQRHTAH